jgi:hypothetical protein
MELLHSLERFFDAALYFAAVGYEEAGRQAETGEPVLHHADHC